jgi:hypothetical protein
MLPTAALFVDVDAATVPFTRGDIPARRYFDTLRTLDESLAVCQIYNTQPLKVPIHNFIRGIFRVIEFVCAVSIFLPAINDQDQ